MDSLWLDPYMMALQKAVDQKAVDQKAVDQKAVGRYPYALVHVQGFSAEPWVMPKKKSRCSMPGPPPLMTYPVLTERLSIYAYGYTTSV